MATIRKREHHDGTFVFQAVIRIKRKGQIVHHESKTFWRYRSALSWAKRREFELEDASVIGESNRREVRPNDAQLVALNDYFLRPRPRAVIPMADIMWFAIYSTRRANEICSLRWTDNDPRTRTGLVRDLKHPGHKLGHHRRFRYTREAWHLASRQPRIGPFIFPYKAASIKEAFRRGCRKLGIDNLRFHDLRHEATSRLFERGYEVHEVQQFTLHSSWQQLLRYTHLRPEQIPDLPYNSSPFPDQQMGLLGQSLARD